MFKWLWLVIIGLAWFAWFCAFLKDVVMAIRWCKERNRKDFYNELEDDSYTFLGATIVILFMASLICWVWSL